MNLVPAAFVRCQRVFLEDWATCGPVGDCKQVSLNDSASIDSTPELPGTGDILVAMAWMEWKVEARTRYSFAVNGDNPSARRKPSQYALWSGKRSADRRRTCGRSVRPLC